MKNDIFLSYIQHLIVLAYLKLDDKQEEFNKLSKELIRLRIILEKIRPLESKLKYQIDKLLKKAETSVPDETKDELDIGM